MAPTTLDTPSSTETSYIAEESSTILPGGARKSPAPVSTITLAAIVAILGIILVWGQYFCETVKCSNLHMAPPVAGMWVYRRRRRTNNRIKAPANISDMKHTPGKKISAGDGPKADLMNHLSYTRQSSRTKGSRASSASSSLSKSSDTTISFTTPNSATTFFVVGKEDIDSDASYYHVLSGYGFSSPTLPKAVAEKHKRSRSKPQPIGTPSLEDMALGISPPSYALTSAGHGIQAPIPPLVVKKKKEASTPPDVGIGEEMEGSPQYLTVHHVVDELLPVISPARSESFAPKDAIMFSPPDAWLSSELGTQDSTDSPMSASGRSIKGNKPPRLMNVIKPYIPTLPDELRATVGDTLRVLQTYNDGWCFVQFVGKVDAQKGVIPLVCLQERRRFVPARNDSSMGSLTSLNWR